LQADQRERDQLVRVHGPFAGVKRLSAYRNVRPESSLTQTGREPSKVRRRSVLRPNRTTTP
jgi:hypothetical protein